MCPDISPAIVDFSFFDGVATRTLADSFLCSFQVATDGAGRITRWQIGLRQFPLVNPGDPFHAIDSIGLVGVFPGSDFAGYGPGPVNGCDPIALSPYASVVSNGTWSSDHPLPADPTTTSGSGIASTAVCASSNDSGLSSTCNTVDVG